MATDPYVKLASAIREDLRSESLVELKNWLGTLLPDVDVNGVAIGNLLLYPAADREGMLNALIQVLRDYSLLKPLPINSLLGSSLRDEIIAKQIEEFNLSEVTGQAASGILELKFSSGESQVIPEGSEFVSSSGTAFVGSSKLLRVVSEGVNDSRIVPLIKRGDSYVATIPVSMREVGVAGNVPIGTAFSSKVSFAGLISVTAAVTFSGGRDEKELGDIVNAFLDNRVAKVLGSRDQIAAVIRSGSTFGDVKDVGIVGSGDPEMHRDKIKFVPGGGGMTDIYVASGSLLASLPVTLTATPITRPDAGPQRYTISVGRDVAPGFLDVISVTDPVTGNALSLEKVERGIDVSPILGESVPQISDIRQGTYSRFQTATITISDPLLETDPVNTQTRSVSVTFRFQPGIAELQSFLSRRSNRFVGGDTLVRAAFPVYVSMQIRLRSQTSDRLPDADKMRQAVVSEIYRNPMRSALYQSDIAVAILPYLSDHISIDAVDFYATYLDRSGNSIAVNSRDYLELPHLTAEQFTSRTRAFYTSAEWVDFTVEQIVGVEIP